MTLLLSDSVFLRHDTGHHVETADRLRAIDGRLQQTGLAGRCNPLSFEPLSDAEIERIHDPQIAQLIQRLAQSGGGRADADTVVSPESPTVARYAAGACCAAVDAVLTGQDRLALCLVRPPGHHATPTQAMGFCLFNNIALAAQRALDKHQVNRILIVDWDVHHGNGTQDIFYASSQVMFLSIHRYGHGFYPGTGAANECGTRDGLGYTRNVALPFGIPRAVYRDEFSRALEECADQMRPELVLVSAGFDAHRMDPIGSLGLETEDYAWLTEQVLQVARTHCGGRLVSCLEGGYNLTALSESVQAHLETLIHDSESAGPSQQHDD